MVSASHNPARRQRPQGCVAGRKADDEAEDQLERLIVPVGRSRIGATPSLGGRGRHRGGHRRLPTRTWLDAAGDALRWAAHRLDCANGSASILAPHLFRSIGADVTVHVRRSRTARISTATPGRPIPSAWRRGGREPGLTSGWPSTATPIGSSRWTPPVHLVDGDAVMGICALQMLEAGTPAQRVCWW